MGNCATLCYICLYLQKKGCFIDCVHVVIRYFLVAPTAQQTRSFDWLRGHLPTDGSVQMNDVTSMYTALDVIGPKANELLSELTDTPLSKQDFMHMTCKVWVTGVMAVHLSRVVIIFLWLLSVMYLLRQLLDSR